MWVYNFIASFLFKILLWNEREKTSVNKIFGNIKLWLRSWKDLCHLGSLLRSRLSGCHATLPRKEPSWAEITHKVHESHPQLILSSQLPVTVLNYLWYQTHPENLFIAQLLKIIWWMDMNGFCERDNFLTGRWKQWVNKEEVICETRSRSLNERGR